MFLDKLMIIFVTAFSFTVFACAGPEVISGENTEFDQPASMMEQKDYLLGIGDVIRVEFYYNPEMNRDLTIRTDGKITLPFKGDISAAGLTPNELKEQITSLFTDVFKDPVVTVTVNEFGKNNFVYVMGEVGKPNYYSLEAPTTLTQVLAVAGGFLNTAELNTVLVVRQNSEGQPVGKLINVNKILSEPNLSNDVLLKKYDIVYVPKSAIAKVDLFVEQYINRIIPNAFRVGYGFTELVRDRTD